MSKLFAAAVAALLLTQSHAAAEEKMVVDMSKMTCAELTKLGFQDFAGITMWMSGYYNASVRSKIGNVGAISDNSSTTSVGADVEAARMEVWFRRGRVMRIQLTP